MPSDLVRRAIDGDRAAQETLVASHGARVHALCRRLASDPDDAYQAVWERVFRALPGFDPDGPAPFGRWIAVITRRHLVDRHRRRRVRGIPEPVEPLASDGPDAEALLEARLRQERLAQAVAMLPDAQRRVIVGHHLEGLALDALAEAEGVPVGTIKSRLHRGRAALARHMRSPDAR